MTDDYIPLGKVKAHARKEGIKKIGKSFARGFTSSLKSLKRKKQTIGELQAEESRLGAELNVAKKRAAIAKLKRKGGGSGFGAKFMNFADALGKTKIGREGLSADFSKGRRKKNDLF